MTPIRSLHEFMFSENHVNVKRVSKIGLGKEIRLQPINFDELGKYHHKIVNEHQLKHGKPKKITLNPLLGTTKLEEDLAEPFDGKIVFDCRNRKCHAEFKDIDELKLHTDGGCFEKVHVSTDSESTMHDFIKKIYIEEMGISGRSDIYLEPNKGPLYHMEALEEPSLTDHLLGLAIGTEWSPLEMTLAENLSMGFALPSPTHKNKICKEARDYVEVIFSLGMGAGGDQRNATALEVCKRMKVEESEPGKPRFKPSQFLDEQQIKYLFFTFGKKLKDKGKQKPQATVAPPPQADDAAEQDAEARQIEEDDAIAFVDAIEASVMVDRAVDQLENVNREAQEDSNEHPIQMSGVNICDLAQAIENKKRRDASPLACLENETIMAIANFIDSFLLSQELLSSKKTREAKFRQLEQAIITHVKYHCSCWIYF